jgi:hypothetical protein
MLAWAVVWWSAAVGLLPLRWVFFVLCSVAALLCCGAAVWVQQQMENRRVSEAQSASADQDNNESANLHAASEARATDEMTTATLHESEHGSGNAAVAAELNGVQQSASDAVVPVGNRPAEENRASSQKGTASTAASSRANTKQAEEDYE